MIPFRTAKPAALVAVFLSLTAPTAMALTAEEVWADWQRLLQDEGNGITAIARRDGNRLVLTNITIPIGEADDLADMKIGRIELEDRPDGTVAVRMPERFPVTIRPRDTSSASPDIVTLTASAPGFAMSIAGIGDTAAFDITAPSLALSVEKVEPALGVEEQLDVNLAVADLALKYGMDLSQPKQTITSTLRLGTLHADLLLDLDSPENERTEASIDVANLTGAFDVVEPPSAREQRADQVLLDKNPIADILTVLSDGLVFKADLSFGAFDLRGGSNPAGQEMKFAMSSVDGKATAKLDPVSGGYDLGLGKTELSVKGVNPELQYQDITMSFADLAYGLSLGIGDLTSVQDGRFTARVTDFIMPPELWAEVDPSGSLGQSPMSVAIEVLGRYALLPEMLEPDWQPDPNDFPPMDIVDLTLKQLMISQFGVNFTGNGSLTFDEADLATYEGVPAPDGKLSFRATGVNALIDRLSAAGMLPPDDLSGIRMGLMFIAKPDEGPDSLRTDIEFREKSFYLNGVKIR
jgi:Uncharacterized protein conserved in bacteria (DUF2125)